jgi:transposase
MADSDSKPTFGSPAPPATPQPRLRPIIRNQFRMLNIDVERLLPEDHAARAIWDLVGQLDLNPFYEKVKAVEGHAGQPPFDPHLMISMWVYGISRGINSARELSEWCEWEPGLQWLCAMESVNYHSLSTFRVTHGEALRKLVIELLGVLRAAGLIGLERMTVDGTRIVASCSEDSFRQGKKLEEYLREASAHVGAVEQEPEEAISNRQRAARERSQRERQQRVQAAKQQLHQLQQERGEQKAEKVQVSVTEAEARIMKQSGGSGFAPSYNLQLATDAKQKIIVAAMVSQSGADSRLLPDVMDEVARLQVQLPAQVQVQLPAQVQSQLAAQVLVDGGYISAENLEQMQQRELDLIGPLPDTASMVNKQLQQRGVGEAYRKEAFSYDTQTDTYWCPESKPLVHIKARERSGRIEHEYRAKRSDCSACPQKGQCCPAANACGRTIVRSEPGEVVKAFREKMNRPDYQQLYRQRSEIAEFPNAWLKEKLGLRRFRLRGLAKVSVESLWAVITYDVQQWIRLVRRQPLAA